MLHFSIVCNLLASVTNKDPFLNLPDLVPKSIFKVANQLIYPFSLPISHDHGKTMLTAPLAPAYKDQIDLFVAIELPDLDHSDDDQNRLWDSIGDLYTEIEELLTELNDSGDISFGNVENQIVYKVYYPSVPDSGSLKPVTDLKSAKEQIEIIKDQGEGSKQGRSSTDDDSGKEYSHYQKFLRCYNKPTNYYNYVKNMDVNWKTNTLNISKEEVYVAETFNNLHNVAYSYIIYVLAEMWNNDKNPLKSNYFYEKVLPFMKVVLPQCATILQSLESIPGPTFSFSLLSGEKEYLANMNYLINSYVNNPVSDMGDYSSIKANGSLQQIQNIIAKL